MADNIAGCSSAANDAPKVNEYQMMDKAIKSVKKINANGKWIKLSFWLYMYVI